MNEFPFDSRHVTPIPPGATADYFRFQTDWYGAPNSTLDAASGATVILPGVITPERQVVNYVNAGATYHW